MPFKTRFAAPTADLMTRKAGMTMWAVIKGLMIGLLVALGSKAYRGKR